MKAGIVIDGWKERIFAHHLRAANFQFDVSVGLTADTKTIFVYVDAARTEELKATVTAAVAECERTGKPK